MRTLKWIFMRHHERNRPSLRSNRPGVRISRTIDTGGDVMPATRVGCDWGLYDSAALTRPAATMTGSILVREIPRLSIVDIPS